MPRSTSSTRQVHSRLFIYVYNPQRFPFLSRCLRWDASVTPLSQSFPKPHYATQSDHPDICNELHYDSASQEGVMFHLIGALSQYGKLGVVCIGKDHLSVDRIYNHTVRVLDSC